MAVASGSPERTVGSAAATFPISAATSPGAASVKRRSTVCSGNTRSSSRWWIPGLRPSAVSSSQAAISRSATSRSSSDGGVSAGAVSTIATRFVLPPGSRRLDGIPPR